MLRFPTCKGETDDQFYEEQKASYKPSKGRSWWWNTTPEQDQSAIAEGKRIMQKKYNLYKRNCSDMVSGAAKAADIPLDVKPTGPFGATTPRDVNDAADRAGGQPPPVD